MSQADDYKKRVDAIIAPILRQGHIHVAVSSPAEAKAAKAHLILLQKQIRLIKKEVSTVTSQIRAQYSSAITEVGKGSGAAFQAGLFGRKNTGRMNSSRRDDLRKQEQQALAPYDGVQQYIDQVLLALDQMKVQLDQQIAAGPR